MTEFCPDLSGDAAVIFVAEGQERFTQLAEETYQLAVTNLNNLGTIMASPVEFNVDFDFQGQLGTFRRPVRPTLNFGDFVFRDPGQPGAEPTFTEVSVDIETAPTFDHTAPALQFGARPTAPNIAAPIAPPRPAALVMPDRPDYEVPPVPTLDELQLPTFPDLEFPEFTSQRPVFIDPGFNENWNFTPTAYTAQLLDNLKAEILRKLDPDESALPLAIQNIIFNRGRSRAEREVERNVETTIEEWSNRGFTEPPGMLKGRVLEVRRDGQDKVAELNSDLAIKAYEEALKNLRDAVAEGTALEGVFIQLHVEEQRYALEAARFGLEGSVAILAARVSVFNTQMQGYRIDAEVLEIQIRAELAKLEELRAEIELEKLRGDFNEQKVKIYAERWRAVGIMADFYKTSIEAVRVQGEANKIPIEIFREEVNAYGERYRAYASEWQAYSASVDGEGKKADVFKTLADIFGTETQAYSVRQGTKFQAADLRIKQSDQQISVYQAGLARIDSMLRGESARLAAAMSLVEAQTRIYQADAGIETAASAAQDRTFELALASRRADVDTQIKGVELAIQQNIGLLGQLRDIRGTIAQVSGNLASSAFSAVNYSASVSSSRSKGINCSTNFGFTGEIVDANMS